MRSITVVAVLTVASLTRAVAQGPLPLEAGQRVRVTVPSLAVVSQEETFRTLRGDTIVLESLSCPLTHVARLEVYAGRRAHAGRGALIGAGVGVLIGLPIGIIAQSSYECDSNDMYPCIPPLPTVPLVLGLYGAGLGALTGLFIKTDVWEEVSLDRVQVSIAPTRNGVGIAARIAF